MDTALIDYELGFNIRLGLDKASRLRTGESAMTHAMVLTGVHVVEGKSVRWRVQNSWGKEAGTEGWFVMSEGWFDEWVYQVVVGPRYVSGQLSFRLGSWGCEGWVGVSVRARADLSVMLGS